MLDIQFIRSHKEDIAKAIKNKGLTLDVEKLLAKDQERITLLQEIEELKSLKNDINELIQAVKTDEERAEIIAKGKEIKAKLDEQEPLFAAIKREYDTLMAQVPNIVSP